LGAVVRCKSNSARFLPLTNLIYLPIRPLNRSGLLEPCHMGKKPYPLEFIRVRDHQNHDFGA